MSKKSKNSGTGHQIELTHFSFPEHLDDGQANFRLQVDLRYRKSNGEFATKTVIMPGLHSYWECSKDENLKYKPSGNGEEQPVKQQKDRYKRICVRKCGPPRECDPPKDDKNKSGFCDEVDVGRIEKWDRSFRVHANNLYELRVAILDVDREDWFDKVVDTLKGAIGVFTAVPVVGSVLEPLIEGAASSVGNELVSSDDKVLFIKGAVKKDRQYEVEGDGYKVKFLVTNVPESSDRDNPNDTVQPK